MPRDCQKDPCDLCKAREEGRDCGCSRAGLAIDLTTDAIQRCDACALFESDTDATQAADQLFLLLGRIYREDSARSTVADAFDLLEAAPKMRAALAEFGKEPLTKKRLLKLGVIFADAIAAAGEWRPKP